MFARSPVVSHRTGSLTRVLKEDRTSFLKITDRYFQVLLEKPGGRLAGPGITVRHQAYTAYLNGDVDIPIRAAGWGKNVLEVDNLTQLLSPRRSNDRNRAPKLYIDGSSESTGTLDTCLRMPCTRVK